MKPQGRDRVFDPANVDLSAGRQMGVDLAAAKKPTASAGEFDGLDDLFGSSPKPKGRAPGGGPPPASGPGTDDPFSDASTLELPGSGAASGGGGARRATPPSGSPPPPADDSDPFGGLFDSAEEVEAPPRGPEQGKRPGAESAATGNEFDTLLSGASGEGALFGAGTQKDAPASEQTSDVAGQSPEDLDPSVQWGVQKKVTAAQAEGPVWPKALGIAVALIALFLGFRGVVEFAPEALLESGVSHETLAAIRDAVPFIAENPNFPTPRQFYEISTGRTFVIENQFGKRLFVAEGNLTNTGPGPRSFFSVQGRAADADGAPLGSPETVFAGNVVDIEALKRLPLGQVRQKLRVKFGTNGNNFEVPEGRTLPFMLVFTGWDREPVSVEIIEVDAINTSG